MKKWLIVVLAIFVWTHLAYGAPVSQKKWQAGKSGKSQVAKEDPCKAYIVVEAASGKVLEGENINAKRPPASVTKLMVASIVMEKVEKGEIRLTDKVTISKEASKIGGSQVYLKEGEEFALEDLLKATLVASANDAAYAIAEHVGGSKDEFIRLMNEKAKALNMTDTEFHSVHGLPPSKGQEEDMASCNDLAILAREALKYPKIVELTSIKSEGFRGGQFVMNNHNKLLLKMPGLVDGLKTGYYRETGYNVVATAKKNDVRFIVVVMGSPTANIRDSIAIEKFKWAFSRYKPVVFVKKGELVDKDIFLEDGKYRKIKGVASAAFVYPVPSDKRGSIKKELAIPEKVKGEIRENQKLGEIVIKMDNEVIGRVDIVSPVFVPKANLFTRFIRKLGLNI